MNYTHSITQWASDCCVACVATEERERIIKLLTDAGHEWHVEMECSVCEAGYCHCDSIRLIKGEEA